MLILGPNTIAQMSERAEGAQSVVDAHPGAELQVQHHPTLSVAIGRIVGEQILAMPQADRPDAVFAGNDLVAIGLMQIVGRALNVPADLAVLGYDDIDFAAASIIPISSIGQPTMHMGSVAAQLLIDELAAGGAHKHRAVGLQPRLMARESTLGVDRHASRHASR